MHHQTQQIKCYLSFCFEKLIKLSRLISKKKYNTNTASEQLIEIATKHGQIKNEYEEKREELEKSMNEWLKFTNSVSEIVTLLHTKSSEWENSARELSIFYQDIADTSIPSEFQKTRDITICIQADEPMLDPKMIDKSALYLKKNKRAKCTILGMKIANKE